MAEPDLNLMVSMLRQVIEEQGAVRGELRQVIAEQGAVRGELRQVIAEQGAVRGELRQVIAEQGAMRAEVTGLRVAVMDRFDRVETRLGQISDDMTVTMGRADMAALVAVNTRDELRVLAGEVAILTRKQRMLESQVHDLTRPTNNK